MILFGAYHSQRFSDKTFERLEIKSGILDINSVLRRKVDGIGRPPLTVLIDRPNRPLTTGFAARGRDWSDQEAYETTAAGALSDPFCLVERRIRAGLT